MSDCASGRRGSTARRRAGGFTLVEILVVLALIGMLVLVSVINLITLQRRFALETEVTSLTAFLQDVPNYAREINAPVFLLWDSGTRSFSVSSDSGGTNVLDSADIATNFIITNAAAPVLRCDIYGRVFSGTDVTMVTTPQTLSLTHRDTPEPSAPTYRLSISPLWAVEVSRQ